MGGVKTPMMMRRTLGRTRDRIIRPLLDAQERLILAVGRREARYAASALPSGLAEAEFRIFSQWGEDGAIQFLLARSQVDNRTFVEIGVEDYCESNTRFLLENDLWSGLIIDAGTDHIEFSRRRRLGVRHTLDARSAFVTRYNINNLIEDAGVRGDIGLLSIDVDGMDYWLFEALEVISPRIVVIEYNSLFGPTATVTVPYFESFSRARAHWSQLYYGASLAALDDLARRRGYRLVGCGTSGVNAFFVRDDVAGDELPRRYVAEVFVQRQHREARDRAGTLTGISDTSAQLGLIKDLDLIDITNGESVRIEQAFGL